MKDKLMSFRIPVKIEKEIEELALHEDSDKSKLIRELIILGIKERKLKRALELYVNGRVSLWKAARLAELSLWGMMSFLQEKKIPVQYGKRDLDEDLKALRE